MNVSRPHLTKLLDRGDIHQQKVGRHRRVKAKDRFDSKDSTARERDVALTELATIDVDLI